MRKPPDTLAGPARQRPEGHPTGHGHLGTGLAPVAATAVDPSAPALAGQATARPTIRGRRTAQDGSQGTEGAPGGAGRPGQPATPARRRTRVVVVDSTPHGVPDRLDEEFEVVMRLSTPLEVRQMEALLLLCQPKLLLMKLPVDSVDPRLMAFFLARRVDLLVLARPTYGLLRPARLRRLGGLLWVSVRWPVGPPACGRVKRALDVTLVLLSLPALLPLMLAIAAVVGLTGPPLYRQYRVGEGGRLFRIVKFRTMRPDAEAVGGPQLATPDDQRVTTVGRILRRTRLDELPQLWNVLRGDMSLVGPRPERPAFVAEFQRLPHYDLRHLIRPGLTGIAQLTGGYAASAEEKLRYDLLYLSCRSLRLDLTLLTLTALDMLRGFPRG